MDQVEWDSGNGEIGMPEPATPLPASTVVLARPDAHGKFEVYLNRRPDQMEAYAGVHVFPGGRVEKSDYSSEMLRLTYGVTPIEAQRKLGAALEPEVCLAYWIAAARELFEEAGIHFFLSADGMPTEPLPEEFSLRLSEKRSALQRGQIDFPALLNSEGLRCDVAHLCYFFHRVTPEHYPVRFDTRFYIAALPPHQVPLHASEEVAESLWISPDEAIERAAAGGYRMMPPTLAVLHSLSRHGSWDALCKVFNLS